MTVKADTDSKVDAKMIALSGAMMDGNYKYI